MEVIEGQPLSARLAERPLPIDEVLRIGLQLAEAVAHAHDRGIVHHDLKSANVMLTPAGHVKVLDFGLAKRVSADLLAEASTRSTVPLTRPMTILGTLVVHVAGAASREAGRRGERRLGRRRHPSRNDSGRASVRRNDGVRSQFRHPQRRAGAAAGASPRRTADSHRPLSRQGASAPLSARQRSARRARSGSRFSTIVPSPSPAHRSSFPCRHPIGGGPARGRRRSVLAHASRTASRPVQRIQSIAVLPLENLSGDAGQEYFVTGVHEALITDLARIGLQKVIAKPSVDAFKGTKKSLHDTAQELGVEGLVTGSVIRAGDRIQISAQLVRADTGAVVWANRYRAARGRRLVFTERRGRRDRSRSARVSQSGSESQAHRSASRERRCVTMPISKDGPCSQRSPIPPIEKR